MSAVETESDCLRDISNMLPKWFKFTRSIKCGRKIICTDQLYGWRGIDTGYYGSEEVEDAPDFLDEVKIPSKENEVRDEQLEALRQEAVDRLKKERETHPNFNILTDRAPTPDFSITYIETSCNTDDESVNRSQEESVTTTIVKAMDTTMNDAASGENNSSDYGEPMELDGSSYFRCDSYHHNRGKRETIDTNLNSGTNLTYTVEKNEYNKDLLLLANEDLNIESCKPMLGLKLDETVTVAEPYEAEGNITVEAERRGNDEIAQSLSQRQKTLDGVMELVKHQTLQAADANIIQNESAISPQPTNQKIFGYPAPLQATFDLSRIDKVDLSSCDKNEVYPSNPRSFQSSRFDLIEHVGSGIMHLDASRQSDRTMVSFKTPRQHVKTSVECTFVKKQPNIATPLFKKRCLASSVSRGTSTPVEESAHYVCPRYDSHHAALASQATQTGSGTPLSVHNKVVSKNASTPLCFRLSHFSRTSCEPTTEKVSTPSRIPLSTSALAAILQYGTPSNLSERSALVDYGLTPQSHLNRERALSQQTPARRLSCAPTTGEASTPSRIPISTSALTAILQYDTPSPLSKRIALVDYELTPQSPVFSKKCTSRQIPMSRFAFEHLKSGGTPRPILSTEKKWQGIVGGNSLLSIPRTPVAKADISQMLVDNAMRSGPAYRRRPHASKLLSPIGKLRFEKSAENSRVSSSPAVEVVNKFSVSAQDEMNETQFVVIGSFDGEEMEKIANDTASLSISDQQSTVREDQKIIFDTTTSDYRKQEKTPVFDTGNYFGQRRILSMLNESNVSVNTPGKEGELVTKRDPSFNDNPSDTSASPLHIVAAKDENKHTAVLCARKIVYSHETGQGLRRSTRKRVAPIRRWLGEKPVYRRDDQGTYELVRVDQAIVKDPLFVKYNTVDMAEALERQKREQRQHSRARRLRKFDRERRTYAAEDAKTNE